MDNARPLSTPLPPNTRQSGQDCPQINSDKLDPKHFPYKSLIGSLLYFANCTRPDISAAVGQLCRYTHNPGKQHWNALQHLLRYLQGTSDLGILIQPTDLQLVGYSDASWGDNPDDRTSTTGYVFLLGGTPISWKSKKQATPALSTCEAEYQAASQAAQEISWLRGLLENLGFPQAKPTPLYIDNQAAILHSKANRYHARTKHFDIKLHHIRNLIKNKTVEPIYVPTTEQLADILTKILPRPIFQTHRLSLGITNPDPDQSQELEGTVEK